VRERFERNRKRMSLVGSWMGTEVLVCEPPFQSHARVWQWEKKLGKFVKLKFILYLKCQASMKVRRCNASNWYSRFYKFSSSDLIVDVASIFRRQH
jgi:hypothetical protein